MPKVQKKIIGWREWASLPDLDISWIKVKTDSGAATSALHADDIRFFSRKGKKYVRFKVQPLQKKKHPLVECKAELIEKRTIKSSNGQASLRPIIQTTIKLGEDTWTAQISLVNRDVMGFRMLLGRQALKNRFLIDTDHSYLKGKKKKKKKKTP